MADKKKRLVRELQSLRGIPYQSEQVLRWQQTMASMTGGGWIGFKSAHAAYDPDRWPLGCYFDLSMLAYYVPIGD